MSLEESPWRLIDQIGPNLGEPKKEPAKYNVEVGGLS